MSSIHGVHHLHFPNFQGALLKNQDGFVHLSDANAAPVVAKMFFANVQAGLGTEMLVAFQLRGRSREENRQTKNPMKEYQVFYWIYLPSQDAIVANRG